MVKLKKEIQNKEKLIRKIKKTLVNLNEREKTSINSTDPDAVKAKGRQGTHATHNVQSVTDKKHGLIVHAEAVSESNDLNQLSPQIDKAIENLEKKPEHVAADAGYASTRDLKKIDKSIHVVVPSNKQAHQDNDRHAVKKFDKEQFIYDKDKDEYICPEGKRLKRQGIHCREPLKIAYRAKAKECQECQNFKICTESKKGRKIVRMADEEVKEHFEAVYASPEGQAIYKFRKEKVELPFGHMKRNLGAGQFMLRGQPKVNAEVAVLSTCFNIARMITILGVPELILRLKGA